MESELEKYDNYTLIRELERRGAVICQWWAEDVLYAQNIAEPHSEEMLEKARDLLDLDSVKDGLMSAAYDEAAGYLNMVAITFNE